VREESVGIGRFEGTFDICLLCRGSGIWTWTTGRVKTWLGSESFLQTPFLPPSLPPSLPSSSFASSDVQERNQRAHR
jgi:hypothetical protein